MVDTKFVLHQICGLEIIVTELWELKVEISKSFRVGAIIVKLPKVGIGYRKKFLHNREDINLEELQKQLRIEKETIYLDSKDNMVLLRLMSLNLIIFQRISKSRMIRNSKSQYTKKFSRNCFFHGKKREAINKLIVDSKRKKRK